MTHSASANTSAGNRPPLNNAAIETPVTEPMEIRTRLGGIVSDIAPDDASKATSSPGFAPLRLISGNSTGATAAMSAALEPEIPDTDTSHPPAHRLAHRAHGRATWRENPPLRAPCRSLRSIDQGRQITGRRAG